MNNASLFKDLSAVFRFFSCRDLPAGTPLKPWLIPLAGSLLGVAAALFAGAVTLLFGKWTGGILSAILIPLVIEILTGWRGLTALAAFIDARISGLPVVEALAVPRGMRMVLQSVMIFASLYLLRMAAFGILAAKGGAFCCIPALGGAALIQWRLTQVSDGRIAPMLAAPEEKRLTGYFLYVVCCAVCAVFAFRWLNMLFPAWCFVLILCFFFSRLVQTRTGAANMNIVHVLGKASETILLLLCLIFL